MEYRILIEYYTGNSFGSYKTSKYLELTWKNLDVATQNLLAIKEHYEMQNANKNDYKDKDWYVEEHPGYCIRFRSDDGDDWQISCFWIGHFEELVTAKIELVGVRYDFN